MLYYAKKLISLLWDGVLAPPFCAGCKTFLDSRTIFCKQCENTLQPIVSSLIKINSQYSVPVIAISDYKEPLRSLIVAKSWQDIVASSELGELIWQRTYFKDMPCDYLIPIPLHWTRFARRGYNQAQEIAQVLSKHRGVPVINMLKRIKRTPFQSKIPYLQRAGNVSDAFELTVANPKQYEGKTLVLVDDLCTTGSTIKNAAQQLIPLKPAAIIVVVAARVV